MVIAPRLNLDSRDCESIEISSALPTGCSRLCCLEQLIRVVLAQEASVRPSIILHVVIGFPESMTRYLSCCHGEADDRLSTIGNHKPEQAIYMEKATFRERYARLSFSTSICRVAELCYYQPGITEPPDVIISREGNAASSEGPLNAVTGPNSLSHQIAARTKDRDSRSDICCWARIRGLRPLRYPGSGNFDQREAPVYFCERYCGGTGEVQVATKYTPLRL